MKLRLLRLGILCLVFLASGCAVPALTPYSSPALPSPAQTPPYIIPSPSPMPAQTPQTAPFPTAIPPVEASFAFVGDILMMQSQITTAKTGSGYDFMRSFEPMLDLFTGVDVMCGNYEGTFAGADAGYSKPRATREPVSASNPSPKPPPYQTFNAPDELASNLRSLGFDALTTANNHCLDRGYDGLCRTIEVINAAGLSQTGTFSSEQARQTPLVFNVNGIRVGLVAATQSVNSNDGLLRGTAREFSVARLFDGENRVKNDIAACHAAGAEFIIVCAHWGNEFENAPNSRQKRTAKTLAEWGADAIIGSHPHVVQPIGYVNAERGGKLVTAFVAWSLGNFISNMAPSPEDYGLFLRLTLSRGEDGAVYLKEAAYLPVYCARQKLASGERLHQTLPCYEDASRVKAFEPLDGALLKNVCKAREYVIKICGTEAASLIG